MAQVTCAQCQAKLVVPELQAKRGKCPKCGGLISGHASLRSDDARPASLTAAHDGPLPLAEESVAAPPRPARPAAGSGQRVVAPPDEELGEEPEQFALSDEPAATAHHAPADEKPQQPPSTPGGLVVTQKRGATIAAFQNHRILDAVVIETIGQELASLLNEEGNPKLILDFDKVEFLSSQMIGVLLSCQKKATAGGKRVILCALAPGLQKLFKIVRLDRSFQIREDRQSALRA